MRGPRPDYQPDAGSVLVGLHNGDDRFAAVAGTDVDAEGNLLGTPTAPRDPKNHEPHAVEALSAVHHGRPPMEQRSPSRDEQHVRQPPPLALPHRAARFVLLAPRHAVEPRRRRERHGDREAGLAPKVARVHEDAVRQRLSPRLRKHHGKIVIHEPLLVVGSFPDEMRERDRGAPTGAAGGAVKNGEHREQRGAGAGWREPTTRAPNGS